MRKLTVKLNRTPEDQITIGILAEQNRQIYFEYTSEFLETKLQLSPYKLPLQLGLFESKDHSFGPLHGLFDDSLPDGWGLLLMNRHFQHEGVDPATLSPLDRLSYLGQRTMGSLTYHPSEQMEPDNALFDLFALGKNAEKVFAGELDDVLPQLKRAGGSPGGARPKILIGLKDKQIISGEGDLPENYQHWIVKFSAKEDALDAGPMEYAYSMMATDAGIDMPDVRLFKVTNGKSVSNYFGIKRFDRSSNNKRIHIHTFANLIHANFRIPSTDYTDLFKVTQDLTRNYKDVLQLFRRMVFNIAAHNRDDHSKNFTFRMDESGSWSLSPAYDLTFALGPGGEHSTTVLGEGRNPSRIHCLKLAEQFSISKSKAISIIEQVNQATQKWKMHADIAGCSKTITQQITAAMLQL